MTIKHRPKFRSFYESRAFIHDLGLRSQSEWRRYCKSGNKTKNIPSNPDTNVIYKKYWINWGDWLGTGRVADQNKVYRDFSKAREFVHLLMLKNKDEWMNYCKSIDRPEDIPVNPRRTYRKRWKGWGDWLGTGYIAPQERQYRPFEEARTFVQNLGLKSRHEWERYCRSGRKPKDIPYQARHVYLEKWKGWGDWLGTGTIAAVDREFLSFEDAKDFVQKLRLKNQQEWREYSKTANKPLNIPANPSRTYPDKWKGYGDWLGTGYIATQNRQYLSFEEAKGFVQKLRIQNLDEWRKYCRSEKKPQNIPNKPYVVYKKDWISWGDWLGTGRIANQIKGWSIEKVKEL